MTRTGLALKPRTAFLIESLHNRAGMERVTVTVAVALLDLGFPVEIICLRGEASAFPLPSHLPLRLLDIPMQALRMRQDTVPIMRAVRRHLRQHPADVLVTVDTLLAGFAFPATLGLGLRRVAWEHFNFHTSLNMRSRPLARLIAAQLGDDVLTLTERDAAAWRAAFPRAHARIRALPNPLTQDVPQENPYDADQHTVLAAGRLDGQKGFDLLLDAWAQVERAAPDWRLLIHGAGTEEAALRRQAQKLGLRRWELRPPTDDIAGAYRSAGLYALSSRHEGLPMTLLEAQAHGVPAVAFDCRTGPAEIIQSGGRLVPAENVPAFAQALTELMGDRALRQRLSHGAFQDVRRFSHETVMQRWVTLLQEAKSPRAGLK